MPRRPESGAGPKSSALCYGCCDAYAQEYKAEFVDWAGKSFFMRENLLTNDAPEPFPQRCLYVFATLDTAFKTGKEHDGTAVIYWAYERLGNFDEAVKHLERAVELKPQDPTINDHLGDVYWKVGRRLEARFQWTHARDLKPEAADLEKIEHKLKVGLVEETSSSADADKPKKPGDGG